METRPVIEIQHAHDALVGVVTGEVPIVLEERQRETIAICASVLCWVLKHDHNQIFEKELVGLLNDCREAGYELENYGN